LQLRRSWNGYLQLDDVAFACPEVYEFLEAEGMQTLVMAKAVEP